MQFKRKILFPNISTYIHFQVCMFLSHISLKISIFILVFKGLFEYCLIPILEEVKLLLDNSDAVKFTDLACIL